MSIQNLSDLTFESLLQKYIEDKKATLKPLTFNALRGLQRQDPTQLVDAGCFYLNLQYYDYAIEWFKRAGSNPRAKLLLGEVYYLYEHNVPNDYNLARHYFEESKNATACFHLGEMYNEGQGVKKNKQKALRWFLRGAISGHRLAKYWTGRLYSENALDNQEDAMHAYYWLSAAITRKDHNPAIALRSLKEKLDYNLLPFMKTYEPFTNIDQVYFNDDKSDDSDKDIFETPIPVTERQTINLPSSPMNIDQPSEYNQTQELQQACLSQKSYIKELELQLHQRQQSYNNHTQELNKENETLKKRIHDLEGLFYAIASNPVNNPH